MPGWLYLTICFVVPQVWAVGVALGFAWWAKRERERRARSGGPGDYSV